LVAEGPECDPCIGWAIGKGELYEDLAYQDQVLPRRCTRARIPAAGSKHEGVHQLAP
jgi:hypothetical protein